ncbi:MAG: hypothetical protein IRZ04_04470, partial [Rhodospirillales bacterium]|nr:hypothetical protein [Rhodospirillales bacterium]
MAAVLPQNDHSETHSFAADRAAHSTTICTFGRSGMSILNLDAAVPFAVFKNAGLLYYYGDYR